MRVVDRSPPADKALHAGYCNGIRTEGEAHDPPARPTCSRGHTYLRIYDGDLAFVTGVSTNDLDIIKDDLKSAIWSGRVGAGLVFVEAGLRFGI